MSTAKLMDLRNYLYSTLSPQKAGSASTRECVRKPTIVSTQNRIIRFFFSILI